MTMKQVGFYILRVVGTIVLSYLIGLGLAFLAKFVFYCIMILVPALLHTMFDFSFDDIARDTIIGHVTGLGHWVAVVNGKDFPVRLAMLAATIMTIIVIGIIGYVSYKLVQIINGRKIMSLITAFFFLLWMVSLVVDFYVTDFMTEPGVVDKNFWYYGLSGILLLIVLLIMALIVMCSWTRQDIDK